MREKNAERQRRYRALHNVTGRDRNVTGVTVTDNNASNDKAKAEAEEKEEEKVLSSKPEGSDETAPSPERTAVSDVFACYLLRTGKNPSLYKLTKARMNKGLTRLREYKAIAADKSLDSAVALMKLSVDGLIRPDWHAGKNPNGKVYRDWNAHLFKSYENMEGWWK